METKESSQIIKQIIKESRDYWYLFIISFIIFAGIGLFYYKYSPPAYEVGLDLMISSSQDYRRNMQPGDFLQGFQLLEQSKKIDNEIVVLQSFPLVNKTIKDLNFKVAYFFKENYLPYRYWPFYNFPNLFFREMYKNIPFEIVLDENHPQPVGAFFYIKILNDKTFAISLHASNVDIYNYQNDNIINTVEYLEINKKANFGDVIEGPNYSFRVLLNSKYNKEFDNKDLYFSFQDMNLLTSAFQNNLYAKRTSLESSIVRLFFKGNNIQKSIDFLNKLAENYIQKELAKKIYIANMTIEYIDKELTNISASLSQAEGQLQYFKKQHQVMNIEQKTQQLSESIQTLEAQKNEILQNLRFYQELFKYFEDNKDSPNLLAPSSMGVEDPLLNSMIQQLATYNAEKNTLEKKNLQRNPRYRTLIAQIEDLKNSILENIQFYIKSTRSRLDEINSNINQYKFQVSMLPKTQTQLLGYERNFNLNNDIYNFLLQKRAEAQIAKASIVPDSEIIESATYYGKSSSKKMLLVGFTFLIGLLLPTGFIILKTSLSNKISTPEDIIAITKLPIIGKIFHNDKKSINALMDIPLSPVSESIRKLRTNLDFYIKGGERQIILLSSARASEGKSFIAINLAVSFSLLNKKTVLLGFDLRKPSFFYDEFEIKEDIGLTSFLTGKNNLREIISSTGVNNLDIITAGIPHPNPSELFVSNKLFSLFEELKKTYDYIIVDTPPVGIVADALQLMRYSDVNLFIVRQKVTTKDSVKEGISEIENNDVKNVCIVLNDLDPRTTSYGYKGYKTYYTLKTNKRQEKKRLIT